jgi:heterodisulfide reductase subunit C
MQRRRNCLGQSEATADNKPHGRLNIIEETVKTESQSSVKPCYQCGTCTGGCPIAKKNPEFNPRRIVQRFLSKREDKIPKQIIWLCLLCHTCQERCPQDVRPSHVIVALRNKATQDGDVKEHIREELSQICATGWSIPLMSAIAKRRENLGLPPAPLANVDEVRVIIRAMGLDKLAQDRKEKGVQE